MAGLTLVGLEIKTLADVISDYKVTAQEVFADQVLPGDTVDTGSTTALGRIIGVVSPPLADVWEAIQQVNDSFNPNAATGISLDNLVALSGINRYSATPTRAQVVLEGDVNTAISSPTGAAYSSTLKRPYSIVNPVILTPAQASGIGITVLTATAGATYTVTYTIDGVNYVNTSIVATASPTVASILAQLQTALNSALSATFNTYMKNSRLFLMRDDPFQTVTYSVTSNLRIEKVIKPGLVQDDSVGVWPADAMAIDTISVPIIGWDSISNPIPAITGRLQETDAELRERFRNSKFIISANIIEALLDDLRNVAGVTDVQIYENDTDTTDALGVPPHAFLPIVLGGLPTDIGASIWANKPTGIPSSGTTVVQVADSQGFIHDIGFQRPTPTPIFLKLNITNTGALPGDAIALLKAALTSYGQETYFIGDDVIYSRFYTPINSIPGHQVNSFTMGIATNPTGTSNIVIPFNGVATFDPNNIAITIT